MNLSKDEIALIHWALVSHQARISESDRLGPREAQVRIERVKALKEKVREEFISRFRGHSMEEQT